MTERTIDVSYDREADAAYLYLKTLTPGTVARTHCCAPPDLDAVVNLDFDATGKLVGIEILHAARSLPQTVLNGEAEPGAYSDRRPTSRA